jgi:ABC-type sugar transport system ATPase subunit
MDRMTERGTKMSGVDIIYDIEHVTKKFPGVVALNDISLQVRRGEILAIVGENGAGKSTLMNILSGVYEKTEGKLVFDGTPMENMNPLKAKALGIAMVHQELSLSPALSIAENIYQGNLPVTKAHFVDRGRLYADAKRMLNMVGLTKLDPATLVRDINVSQQQQVEIAKALSLNGKFLILDEPTSSLTEGEADILLKNMKDLQQKGITILFISHKLDEVLKISNRVAVFRDGNLIDILDTAETGIDDMISLMVGRKYAGGFQRSRYLSVKDYQNIKPILEVENLNVGKKVFDASFKLYQGELLGITGLVGAGRSEILQAVFGADPKKWKSQPVFSPVR